MLIFGAQEVCIGKIEIYGCLVNFFITECSKKKRKKRKKLQLLFDASNSGLLGVLGYLNGSRNRSPSVHSRLKAVLVILRVTDQ